MIQSLLQQQEGANNWISPIFYIPWDIFERIMVIDANEPVINSGNNIWR